MRTFGLFTLRDVAVNAAVPDHLAMLIEFWVAAGLQYDPLSVFSDIDVFQSLECDLLLEV